ncbi:syntabulin [Chanos chanos]|uniref:Syntabulin n=1 Tax=Chanos chanos TaxID=29144 RepID=A0A6J2W571_CHACN|nr:syntabulin [Chanos chanos]
MGPFQEYKVKKTPEKGNPRSRIPRLVLHPFRPKGKVALSELPFSEEENKDCDISIEHSKRTVSPNSFSSDDTGCPSSQSVSPAKTPSGSDNSSRGSPSPGDRKTKVKRVRVNVMAEWGEPTLRHNREQQRSSMLPRGSEADFSSSSSNGSFKTKESNSSTGKKTTSRSRGSHIRTLPLYRSAGSASAELYAPYRTPTKGPPSTNSSSNCSPSSRRASFGKYQSCGDNHGIKPPNPEQYLTPLQQKEVAIRHLKTKLRESENTVHDRDSEIEELKAQLGRMREDWIEEECHRVEAQLALKEARKEIKQLRQVVETMKNSLMEKDKGIQKYFIDINIQNRKLESLLHSMEMAQNGSSLHDEPTLDFICDSPERSPSGKVDKHLQVEERDAGEMVDSAQLMNDETINQTGIMEQVLMSTAVGSTQDLRANLEPQPGLSTLIHSELEEKTTGDPSDETDKSRASEPITLEEKAVQTEELIYHPDLHALFLQLLKLQSAGVTNPMFSSSSHLQELPASQSPVTEKQVELSPSDPTPSAEPEVTLESPGDSGMSCTEPAMDPTFMEELDFEVKETCSSPGMAVVGKSYWSNNFLVDLVAVAAPVLPTVAWLYSRHGVDGGTPVYNIGALIRGCCIMGLHSLRHVTQRPDI